MLNEPSLWALLKVDSEYEALVRSKLYLHIESQVIQGDYVKSILPKYSASRRRHVNLTNMHILSKYRNMYRAVKRKEEK